jgi:hypothetical protein
MLDRLRDVVIVALFGAFLTLFGIVVWSSLSCEPSKKKQNYRADNATVQISCKPFNISTIKSIGLVMARHPNEVAAAVTAVATGVIAWFTIVLSGVGRNQSRDARMVQRAHVFVLRPEAELQVHNNAIVGLRLGVTWRNSGSTPASPVTVLIAATWVPTIEQFTFGEVIQEGFRQPFVLGPGAELASGTVGISAAHILANFRGEGAQLLWGWARYRDVFPNSQEHVIEFCFRVIAEGELGPPPFTGRINFAFHGDHNRYYDE